MVKKCAAVIAVMAGLFVGTVSAAAPQSLSSLSAALYEPQSGRFLYEKDVDTRRPMASTTKLMTALCAAEVLSPDTVVTVPPAAVLVEGSSMGLRGGDTLTVRDLLCGMLLSSGNDAANAAALLSAGSLPAFAQLMNRKASALGMTNSLFVTPSGLDEGGHGSTARDMALLGAEVLRVPLLAELCAAKQASVSLSGHKVTLSNHNRLLSLYEPTVGLKTGFTKKAGRCLVSAAKRGGVTLVVASLNGGDYWNDHMALYDYGFSVTESVTPEMPSLSPLPVAGGTAASVCLRVPVPESLTVLKGETVTCHVEVPAFVWAPVAAGEGVGTIRYDVDGITLYEAAITADGAVGERPPLEFWKKWTARLCELLSAILE